tara:strand:- start:118 stop:297 length:180 start_codon:yes stop_codon:yes gene_type:complete
MEEANTILLTLGSAMVIAAVIWSRLLAEKNMRAARVQIQKQISREELRRRRLDELYGRD